MEGGGVGDSAVVSPAFASFAASIAAIPSSIPGTLACTIPQATHWAELKTRQSLVWRMKYCTSVSSRASWSNSESLEVAAGCWLGLEVESASKSNGARRDVLPGMAIMDGVVKGEEALKPGLCLRYSEMKRCWSSGLGYLLLWSAHGFSGSW